MLDWIAKFFDSISSVRSAAKALGAVFLVLWLWQPVSKKFASTGFPDNYAVLFLTVGAFSASYLVLAFLEFCWLSIKSKLVSLRAKETKQSEFKRIIKKSLPHLKLPELRILRELLASDMRMDIHREGIGWLLRSRWISQVHQLSATEFIFQLNPVVRALFVDYERNQYEEMVDRTVAQLTEEQQKFLDLFWQDTLIYGTQSSQTLMPYGIYHAGDNLVVSLGLSKSISNRDGHFQEQFSLNDYVCSQLQSQVYRSPPVRHEVELDLAYVQGSGATGGGASGAS